MGIGWTEIVVILVVALVFLGPSRFPAAARKLGSYYRELRDALGTIEHEFERAVDADQAPDRTTADTDKPDAERTDQTGQAASGQSAIQADEGTGKPLTDDGKSR